MQQTERTPHILLSTKELEELKLWHRKEKSKRYADRIKAIYLLGKAWTFRAVSEALLLDEDTLGNYIKRYRKGGVTELLKDNYSINEGKLTFSELKELEQHLEEVTYRRTKDILRWVKDNFDEDYTISGMTKLLQRLNFVYKKPKKLPPRTEPQKQRRFIKKYEELKSKLGSEDSIFFMDGTHPHHGPIADYGWIKQGQNKFLRGNIKPKRLSINGAINPKTLQMVTLFEKNLTEHTTLAFLEKLRKEVPRGRIYLVCDQASYYDSRMVREFADMIAITLVYLPPYSPNLNLIERLWHFFQKRILYNQYYQTYEIFEKACHGFFRNIGDYKDELVTLLNDKFEVMPKMV